MKLNSIIGALVIGAGLCSSSYGFEWLDNLLGVDLDNSEGYYAQYSTGYAPYTAGYAAPVNNGYSTYYAPTYGAAGQSGYYTVYQPAPMTSYQPNYQPAGTCNCGNQAAVTAPVVAYPTQPHGRRYNTNRPVYVPRTYAPAANDFWTDN